MPMNYVARALEVDETRGFMKAIVDAESDQILGAAVLGIEGGEIMAMLQLARMGRLPFTTLREAVFAQPTLAEPLNNLVAHLAYGRVRLAPPLRQLNNARVTVVLQQRATDCP